MHGCGIRSGVLSGLLVAGVAKAADKPMNVIFILADDLGWSDTTLYGNTTLYQTPNLERLAQRGMVFTRAHSASPLCSPTRASIMTGQTPARTGITAPNCHLPEVRLKAAVAAKASTGDKALQCESVTRLDTKFPTLGKRIKEGGYATAHFGKWHLGAEPYSPLQHGFDVDVPHWPGPGPAGSYVAPWKFPGFKENSPKEHIEDRMAEEAVKWMKSVAEDKPFFMNYWMFSVHAPFDAKEELIAEYRKKVKPGDPQSSPTYAAMVHSMDDAVGTLLDEVDRLGIADRTAIIFISDNGGNMYNEIDDTTPTCNAPLRGGKATMFEGGTRVPCVVVWPGVTKPGSRSDAIIQTTDFYPTILNGLGLPLPENYTIDGIDIAPALRGETFNRTPIFTYFPHCPPVPDWLPPAMSVHVGDWKLIRLFHQGENGAHSYLLYNLKEDIGEKNNLAVAYPEKVQEMDRLMEVYLKDAGTVVPLVNPAFDPAKYHPEEIGVQKEKHASAKPTREQSPAASDSASGVKKIAGWQTKPAGVGLAVKDDELIVSSTGDDPWITTEDVPKAEGGFVLDMEVWAGQPGDLQVFAGWNGKSYVKGSGLISKISSAEQWVPVSVTIPSGGKLSSLRIDPPGAAGETRLRNIRLQDSSGQTIKQWKL